MIVLAGGTGRVGRQLLPLVCADRRQVRMLARPGSRAPVPSGVELAHVDVADRAAVIAACAGATTVVSLLTGVLEPGRNALRTVDVGSTTHLAEGAHRAGASMVLVSAIPVARTSRVALFRAKYAAEQAAVSSGVPLHLVRAAAISDTWAAVARETRDRNGRPLVFGRGENPIGFVPARAVAELVHLLLDIEPRPEPVPIAGCTSLTLAELTARVQAQDGRTEGPRRIPRTALRLMARQPFRPVSARLAQLALHLDTADQTMRTAATYERFPDLARWTVSESLIEPVRGATAG